MIGFIKLHIHIILVDEELTDTQKRQFLKQLKAVSVPICQELQVKNHLKSADKFNTHHFADERSNNKNQESERSNCKVHVESSGKVSVLLFVDERKAIGFGGEG